MKSNKPQTAACLYSLLLFVNLVFGQTQLQYLDKNISSQVLQEMESIQISLGEYFKGSLLDYQLCITNKSTPQLCNGHKQQGLDPIIRGVDPMVKDLIRVVPPFELLNYTYINESSYKYDLPPFPRSTFLMEDEDGTQIIYFVDRNFMFMRYDINNYTERQAIRQYSIPLNQTILNGTCSDLQRVSQFDDNLLLMLCDTITFENGQRVVYTTLVQIEDLARLDQMIMPTARYLSYKPTKVRVDKNVNIVNIGQELPTFLSNKSTSLFLTTSWVQSRQSSGAVIIKVDITEFANMKLRGIIYEVWTNNEPVDCKYFIQLPTQLVGQNVTDVEMLPISYYSSDKPWLSVLVNSETLVFCQYSYLAVILFFAQDQNLDCTNGTMIFYGNMGNIFHNNRDRDFIYATMISPPGVVEIRVEDPVNAYINKIYSVGDEISYIRYIGQPVMATNQNYILHLMKDMLSDDTVIRVYNKRSNYFSTAMFDYPLPQQSKTNYFVFPNFFFDIFFLRDEEAVYLARMNEQLLALNATNSSMVKQLISNQSNDLFVNLTAYDKKRESLSTTFHVTLVDRDDTDIYAVSNTTMKVLYNCGDGGFSFAFDGFFNGPNYELTNLPQLGYSDCSDGDCYFNITKKDMLLAFAHQFNFSHCNQIFSLPALDNDPLRKEGDIILICIDNANKLISTFSYDYIQRNLIPTDNITIPDSQFLGAIIDQDMRLLMLFTNTTDSGQWILHRMVVHVFTVQNSAIWKSATTIFNSSQPRYPRPDWSMEYNQVEEISYNNKAKRGALVSHPFTDPLTNLTLQMLSIFDASGDVPFITELTSSNLTVMVDDPVNQTLTTRIISADISEEGFIYTLQENNKMVVYEAFDYYRLFNPQTMIVKRWEQSFPEINGSPIIDFDILDGNYIVLYTGNNETLVYQIVMQIYWEYKMVLPLFTSQFQDYQYYSSTINHNIRRVVRSAIGEYLVLLMAQKHPEVQGQDQNEYQLFFYSFKSSQHDSLIMTQNVTTFYRDTSYQNVYQIGSQNGNGGKTALMSDKFIGLYDLTLKNSLVLTNDSEILSSLIQNCSQSQHFVVNQGFMQDEGQNITSLHITPKSRFVTYQKDIQVINLTVVTQNQGLIPIAVINGTNNIVRMSYSGDFQDDDGINVLNAIYMQDLMDGYNLTYSFNCTFIDIHDQLKHCEAGIYDYTEDKPAIFSIEQVTSDNQIFKSFAMNRFFVMLDSNNMIHVLTLKNDKAGQIDDDPEDISKYSLNTIRSFNQLDKFGCTVTTFADYYLLMNGTNRFNKKVDWDFYLLMYQCNLDGVLVFKLSTMIVYNTTQENPDPDLDYLMIKDSIKNLTGEIEIPVPIIDVQIYDYEKHSGNLKMIITISKNGTYNNVVMFYDAKLDLNNYTITFSDNQLMTSRSVIRDTFYVTQVLIVPGNRTHLAILTLSNEGALIVDTQSLQVLQEFKISSLSQYPEQLYQQHGDLEVYEVIGNWPHQIHILTNYGLYIVTFKVDLTDRTAVLSNPSVTLKPLAVRTIKLYFDQYNYEIAANSYGYAFLVTKNSTAQNFGVYLGGVSFYGQGNSRVLKMIPITLDQQCITLTQEPYLGSTKSEDEITVSFVCNTQLFVVKLGMRPYIMTNMSEFSMNSTRQLPSGAIESGYLQYGQFNINFTATNEFMKNPLKSGQISIFLEYESPKISNQVMMSLVYFLIVMLLILATLALLYLKYRQQEIGLVNRSHQRTLHAQKSKYSQRTQRQFRSTYMQKGRENLTYQSSDYQTLTSSPFNNIRLSNRLAQGMFSMEHSPHSSLPFNPPYIQSNNNTGDDPYHPLIPVTKDPYADLYNNRDMPSQQPSNFASELSLGIHHSNQIRSAFKGGRRQSIMDSAITGTSYQGPKLDLQRQAKEETINKKAIEIAKKKDRKALMELIKERDRMILERNEENKRQTARFSENERTQMFAVALNDSQRNSGAQSEAYGMPDSFPKNGNNNRILTSSDDEFTMYKQTNNTKVSSNMNSQGNEQKRKLFL